MEWKLYGSAGRFMVRYQTSSVMGWKSKRIPTHIETETEASRWFLAWIASLDDALPTDNASISPVPVTFAFLLPLWLAWKTGKVNAHFLRQSSTILENWVIPHPVAKLDLDSVTDPQPWVEWWDWVTKSRSPRTGAKLSPNYQRQLWMLTKLVINDAIDNGWTKVQRNPLVLGATKQVRPKGRTRLGNDKVRLYANEVSRLLLGDIPDHRRVKYILAFATGMRDMELQGLQWKDIRTIDEVPTVVVAKQLDKAGKLPPVWAERTEPTPTTDCAVLRAPKSGSSRKIPLHPVAIEVLNWWLKVGWRARTGVEPTPEHPILPTKLGMFDVSRSPELFRYDLLASGLPDKYEGQWNYDFHATRRTFATLLYNAGVDTGIISHLMGHTPTGVTHGHYIGADLHRLAREVAKLPLPNPMDVTTKSAVFSPDSVP